MQETKGQTTKNHILREGLMLASVNGLVNISIGGLATKANMSRSGLFAHFLSKEQLQLEILEYAAKLFNQTVIEPALRIESPTARFKALQRDLPHWYDKTNPQIPGGCIFLMATLEFDDRPGKIKDFLLKQQKAFLNFLKTTHDQAFEAKEFVNESDRDQFAFVFYSFYMGFHQYRKFFGDEKANAYFEHTITQLLNYCGGHEVQVTSDIK